MNIEKLREVIRKYEENYDYFNDQAHDEIFKWNAVQHFQNGSLRRQMSGRFRNYLRTRERSAPC